MPARVHHGDFRAPLVTPVLAKSAAASRPKSKKKRTRPKRKKPAYKVLGAGSGMASYYGEPQATASGERFNPGALTAAHRTLPLGSRVRVTRKGSGKSVIVRINDRGPYIGGRCLDLSKAAMAAIGGVGSGVVPVKYQVLTKA